MDATPRTDWSQTPMIIIALPECPACCCPDWTRIRTNPRETDGSVTRLAKCDSCGQAFRIVEELPPEGNVVVWPSTIEES